VLTFDVNWSDANREVNRRPVDENSGLLEKRPECLCGSKRRGGAVLLKPCYGAGAVEPSGGYGPTSMGSGIRFTSGLPAGVTLACGSGC
jgi:hypothetical protein